MLKTTTATLDGRQITEYLDIVVGEAILGANIFKDIFGAIRDVVGGRSAAYEREMGKARALGADGIDIDYEVVGQQGGMMMVSVSGTAVKFRRG